jgi:cell cycle checkpoint protein
VPSGKRDPPGASASKKDIERDRVLDAGIKDPPKLPSHLKEHERSASRVGVNVRCVLPLFVIMLY